jgi:hypothetical protein
MRPERQQRELLKAMLRDPSRERTFAQLFPWRNVARAVMLLVVILGIIAIKRSTGSMLTRIGDLWGGGAPATPVPAHRATRAEFRTHLGPGLTADGPAPAGEGHSPP